MRVTLLIVVGLVSAAVLATGASPRSGAVSDFVLTVQLAGSGSGTVTSAPAGIQCGTTCSASFSGNVQLTETPAAGSAFSGWGGACSGTGSTCTVAMTQAQSVVATFTKGPPSPLTIAVEKDGRGTGTVTSTPAGIDCGSTCVAGFSGSTQLVATAAAGSKFAGWSGSCTGTGTCTLAPGRKPTAKKVKARFDDVKPPVVKALPSKGILGGIATIRFTASDESGFTKETIVVLRGKQQVALLRLSGAKVQAAPFEVPWRLPSQIGQGTLKFCVSGIDPSKNQSASSCSTLAIRDVHAPVVRALPAVGSPGQTVKLRFFARDDSGATKDTIRILDGGQQLALLHAVSTKAPTTPQSVGWQVPARMGKKTLHFCVRAVDPAGNRSLPSCSTLKIG